MFPSILIVDDEPSILQTLSGLLLDEGFEVMTAANGYEALKIIDRESPDLVLLDIWMPGMDGIDTLKEIKKENPFIQVVIITGHGTIETAVSATKLGAYDFIEKPLSIDKVIVAINNALNFRRLEEENRYLRKKTIEKHSISGKSAPVIELKKEIAQAAPTDSRILIIGENGTGKELVARTIHNLSDRADHPLIVVNCATIPDDQIESELFGHERGAVKGSVARKRGKFELANNGTILLDEIGDMSMATQGKILRFLEDHSFNRVGGTRQITVNVRVIASTNKDLEQEISANRFREDLYFRLNVIPIRVPSLRERIEDLPVLVEHFLSEFSYLSGHRIKKMSREATELLMAYHWPGNVRELKNLMERLSIMVTSEIITPEDIPAPYNPACTSVPEPFPEDLFATDDIKSAKERFEKLFLMKKLEQFSDDIDKAAAAVGVAPKYMRRQLGLQEDGGNQGN